MNPIDVLDVSDKKRIVVIVNVVALDGGIVDLVHALCIKRLTEERRDVLLVLSKVIYCGSVAVNMFLKLRSELKVAGKTLSLEIGEKSFYDFLCEISLEIALDLRLAPQTASTELVAVD